MRRALAFAFLAQLVAPSAIAHPLAPALLELEEGAPGHFAVRWKTPRADDAMTPILPATCRTTGDAGRDLAPGGFVHATQVDCGEAGLTGTTIAIAGLDASGTEALVRIRFADGHAVRALLRPDAPSLVVPARERPALVFLSYLRMGAEHLAGGLDHILFLFGLVALLRGGRRLVAAVTAFTAGHSTTLALASFGLVALPAGVAEIAIAATLVWLALELARRADGVERGPGVGRRPLLLPFVFGLLHGLGFASALGALGVPRGEIPLALAGFNLGIEAGQLALVATLLAIAAPLRGLAGAASPRALRWSAWVPAYGVGSLGVLWCLDRIAGSF